MDDNSGTNPADEAGEWAGTIVGDELEHRDRKEDLKLYRLHWENEVLRQTELLPNEITGGLVYFEFLKHEQEFRIAVPVGENNYLFYFKVIIEEK